MEVINHFNPPMFAARVRVNPKTWYGAIVMRMELYGCSGEVEIRKCFLFSRNICLMNRQHK